MSVTTNPNVAGGGGGAAGQGVPTGGTANQVLAKIDATNYNTQWTTVAGTGDVVGPAASIDSELALFNSTTGKLIKRAALTGLVKATSGVASAATSGTDYSAGTSALATGIVKSTTSTGTLTIAVAGDFPTLNQSTSGSAATLTTPRAINGVNFDGSAAITVTAAAGTLSGTTLAAGVTTSSLTSFGTSPTITTPTISGLVTRDGADILTPTAIGALAVDITKAESTKSISVDSTFTFTGTPVTGELFALTISNTDTAAHLISLPSCVDMNTGLTVSTSAFRLPASSQRTVLFKYDGTVYRMYNSPNVAGPIITDVSAAGTFALVDANNAWRHPAADTTARTWTLPANASIAFPIGTIIRGYNEQGAGAITLAITTDTIQLAGSASTTGSRTVATGGIFIAVKTAATIWMVGGPGVT